ANYWSQELMRDVSGFGAQVRRDAFNVAGWQERPATVPAFNVEVTVPVVTHPEQVVVIGCHYDGEAISTQSANDDGSGCAIELGKMANPLLPFYVDMSPLNKSQLYPNQDKLTQQQRARITTFRALMQQAVTPVFAQFQALGYQTLTYHSDNNQDVTQPVFIPSQLNNLHLVDDTLGGSDQIPFTLAGLPCATFVGNTTYYDTNPPPWSYPFDQKEDTIQLMNTFASGSSKEARALVLALALPGMLTTWMLNQSAILGQAAADSKPIAAISDIGQTVVGQPISLDGSASFDPTNASNTLNYAWDFGDG